MIKTFKTRWFPTTEQKIYVQKACGIRRWTWNWACAEFFEQAKNDVFPKAFDLQKQLNNTLVLDPNYSWLSEVNSMIRGEALKDFGLAIKAYANARHEAKRTVEKLPVDKFKPTFKKKGKCTESFRLFKKSGTEFKVHSAHDFSVVTIRNKPRLHMKTRESVAFLKDADIKNCTFSMKAGKYYIAITYEKTNRREPHCGTGKVGLDLGIKTPVMLWDGTNSYAHQLPETIKRAEKHTEKVNQRLSKTTEGSNRHNKILLQLQKAYAHEANVKKDWRDKFVRNLVEDYSQINLDDFGFEGTLNLKNTHRALYRVGVYAFKIALEYKAAEYGTVLNYVKKFTPTSKTCSACGFVHKGLKLDDRTYVCPECGLILDRDLNAAINTYNYC